MSWNWPTAEYDFAYPLELSSSVYDLSVIKQTIINSKYYNPNTLESVLNDSKHTFITSHPKLMSYNNSRAVCIPLNLTQNVYVNNKHGNNSKYTIDNLKTLFSNGYIMNIKPLFHKFTPTGAHQVIYPKFIKRKVKKKTV